MDLTLIVLGIETSTMQVGCALGGVEGVLGSFSAAHGRRHAETLAPAIQFLCEQTGIALKEVGVVAVDIGPGLFTGLRVGVATAKGIAQALRVPMIGLSSLDLLAFPQRHSTRLIVPAIDARRGEVYTASYRHVPGGVQRVREPQLMSPQDLVGDLVALDEDVLLVGDGTFRYEAELQAAAAQNAGLGHRYPSASALVELAQPKALREEFVQPWELEVLYLRQSDAEINWARREG